MKNEFLLVSTMFLGYVGYSQEMKVVKIPMGARVESTQIIDGVTSHSFTSKSKIRVNGIPFLNDQFTPGKIELNDGRKSEEILLRYNIAKDLFEILRNRDTLSLNRPEEVKHIYFDNKVFIYNPALREKTDKKQNGYFEILVDGKLSLYLKRNKDLSYDSFATNYQGGSGTKEYYYDDKIAYIGKIEGGKAFLINTSKNFIKNINEHKIELKSFIKDQKINFRKANDLVKLAEYYNKL